MATVIIQHSDSVPADLAAVVLRDHGHRLRFVRRDRGEAIPGDLDEVDAIVSCGGTHSPLDDDVDGVAAEMDLLRTAHETGVPVLGICYGSQILARALGGTVGPLDDGIECGWHEIALTPAGREDPMYVGQPWWSRQLCWHRYQVTEPPAGRRVLARSERCPVQAWAVGLRTYGVQYHPEASALTIDDWAGREPADLQEAGLEREQLRRDTAEHHPASLRMAHRFFEAMALTLMPVDRRYAGIARDLHH